jgi:hypothetical protein
MTKRTAENWSVGSFCSGVGSRQYQDTATAAMATSQPTTKSLSRLWGD